MRKWWMGALAAIGSLAASATARSEPPPQAPPADIAQPPAPPAAAGPACNAACPPGPLVCPSFGDRGFDNAFDEPCPCGCLPLYHIDFDYLAWWTKHNSLPVLVSRGNIVDPVPGASGQPNTTGLIGGSIDDAFHNGGRLSLSRDFGEDRVWQMQASGFYLENKTSTAAAGGTGVGTSVIARPFFDINANMPAAAPISEAGVTSGALLVQLPQQVYGGETNLAWRYWSHEGGLWTGSLLVGGRFLAVHEQLLIGESLQDLTGAGTTTALSDSFSTRNYFYGGQVGAAYSWFFGPVTLDVLGKVGFGVTNETLSVNGSTLTTSPGGATTFTNAGLLAQPSNTGHFSHDAFAVAPEFAVDAKYQFNEHIRAGAGYDFLYLSRVLRPGDQVDTNIDFQGQALGQVGTRPAVTLHESGFWMQGLTATLELSF
jgi:hypothetical protein